MSFPSGKAIGKDPVLTAFSVAQAQSSLAHIAREVLKMVPLGGRQTGVYHKWDANSFFKSASDRPKGKNLARAIGGARVRGKLIGATTVAIKAEEYAFEMPMDYRLESRADDALRLRQNYQRIVNQELLDELEQRMVDLAFATANVSQNATLSGVNQWSDATSDPLGDIFKGLDTISTGAPMSVGEAGYELCCATNPKVWTALRKHPQLQSQLGANKDKVLTMPEFMSIFEFAKMFIGRRVKNTAKEGQTATLDFYVLDDFLIYFRPTGAVGLEERLFGGMAVEQDVQAKNYDEPNINSTILVSDHSTDEFLPLDKSGYLIKDTLA